MNYKYYFYYEGQKINIRNPIFYDTGESFSFVNIDNSLWVTKVRGIPLWKKFIGKLGFTVTVKVDVSTLKGNPFIFISSWREEFGLPVNLTKVDNVDEDAAELAYNLIKEEFNELTEAYVNDDYVEIADALGDLIFVIKQMADEYGIDMDKVIYSIYESNMSKSCTTQEEVDKTINKYKGQGIDVYPISTPGGRTVVKRKKDNKVLKSINYKEPNLREILL